MTGSGETNKPTQQEAGLLLPFVVEQASSDETATNDNGHRRDVLAWGIETATGLARHIRELSRAQTGRACGIECVGCGRALEAFNAGAVEWLHRPHFKHPPGTQRADCHIVAARMAIVDALARDGVLNLPARNRPGSWEGMSGTTYEVWRNLSSERARVQAIDYTDRTCAQITLRDGRRLVVMLRGEFSLQANDADNNLACLTIEAGANAEHLSDLSPAELRQRLTLLPNPLGWRCHWKDDELSASASLEAKERARESVDEWPVHMEDMTKDRRRESLLHRLVREVLAESRIINVPGWDHPSEAIDLRTWAPVPEHRLTLSDLRTERGLAGRVPDIQCTAMAQDENLSLPLLAIEIIVHNDLTDAKLHELRAAGAAVLAVNLSNWGGKLTLPELRLVVVTGIECKRWLYHPLQARQMAEISKERAMSVARDRWNRYGPTPSARSDGRPTIPEDDYAAREALVQYGSMYRKAVVAHFDVSHFHNGQPTLEEYRERTPKREDLWIELDWIASELADLGAPGGTDKALLDMMERLLSIYENRGVGHAESQGARAIINHLWTEIKVRDRANNGEAKPSPSAALALIAIQTYELQERGSEPSRPYEEVRIIVRRSLAALESRFLWDPLYVPLVRAVFPKMADAIDELTPRMERIAKKNSSETS